MDRFEAMRIFVRVASRRSFTLAAEDLGVPRTTATDAVKNLEARLGVRLLERTTRVVRPTPDGEMYYQRCVRLLADLEDAESGLGGGNPSGPLRVDVHGVQARHFLVPALPEFLDRYPGIQLHLYETHVPVDMMRQGFDCVVRARALTENSLVRRKLAELESGTFASPSYLARFGLPRDLEDLAQGHRQIGLMAPDTTSVMPLMFRVEGRVLERRLPVALTVTAPATNRAAACAGIGLAQMPFYAAASALKAGNLVEVLADFAPPPIPVHILCSEDRNMTARVRVFIEWMAEQYRKADIQIRGFSSTS